MSYSILLVFDKPSPTSPEQRDHDTYEKYESAVKNIRELMHTNTAIQALAENVLLIPIDDTLDDVAAAVLGSGSGCAYRYVLLSEDLQWRISDKVSK